MRQEQGRHKGIVERVVGRKFNIGHAGCNIGDAAAHRMINQRQISAAHRCVAQKVKTIPGNIREQPNFDGFFHIDIFAKRAADENFGSHFQGDADAIGQYTKPGVDGGFGAQQIINIHIGDDDVLIDGAFIGPGNHILAAVIAFAHARRIQFGVDAATFIDYAGEEHLGQQGDQATATQTSGLDSANHAERGIIRIAIHPNFLDGAFGGAHPVEYASPLEGRPRRASASDQPIFGAKHCLTVGAHIQKEQHFFGIIHPRREHTSADVGADVAGHTGQAIDDGARVCVDAYIGGFQRGDVINAGDKGRQADTGRGDTQQQMDHGAVPGNGGFHNLSGIGSNAFTGAFNQFVDGTHHQIAHLFGAAFFPGDNDARNHIFAARNLLVIFGDLNTHFPGEQIYQPNRDGSGANIHRRAPQWGIFGCVPGAQTQ